MQAAVPDLTSAERRLLTLLQEDLPLCDNPWTVVGQAAGFSGDEVLTRLIRWREQGLIRKIGPSINIRALGWFSSLCAASIPQAVVAAFQAYINSMDAVTHCYLRDNPRFNLWFTLMAPNENAALELVDEIRRRFDLPTVKSFPATAVFKIKAVFDLADTHAP